MIPKRPANDIFAVILVGGKGKRLRPLSTDKRPKAFLSVTRDRKSMFANTLRRIRAIAEPSRIIVVANKAHERLVKKDFPGLKRGNLILESVSRNTGPAVGSAARLIAKTYPDAVIAVLPTDQYIRDEKNYLACLKAAIEFLEVHKQAIVVFGIRPTFPSTEFGYIKLRPGTRKASGAKAFKVERFVEKPDLKKAERYVKSGSYMWNSGTFFFTARTLLDAMKTHAPEIYRRLKTARPDTRAYAGMPDISLDYAVMEKAGNIYCVKCSYGWNDVGSFKSLRKVLRRESRKFVEQDGKIIKIL